MPVQLYRTSRVGILRIGCFTALAVGLAFTFWSATATATTDPVVVPGDANLDGVANLDDIEGFAIAIRAPDAWLGTYRATEAMRLAMGDFNGDGRVDNGDSELFGRTVGQSVVLPRNLPSGPQPSLEDFPAGLIRPHAEPREVGTIDVDIDSDNNNTTVTVGRTTDEEQVEDFAPGKILLVNDDDDDRNGVADQNQAERIIAERDDLVPLIVEAIRTPGPPNQADGINYRLSFPSGALRIWRWKDRGVAGSGPGGEELLNGTVRTARLLGDMNCNGVVSVTDIALFVMAITNPNDYRANAPDCDFMNADVDQNRVVSVTDIGPFVATVEGTDPAWPRRFAPQWLYVEGLQQSSTGGDRTISAEANFDFEKPDGDYDASDSVRASTVRVSTNPTGGPLGTPVTITLSPAILPFQFGSQTAGSWSGYYDALVGTDSASFSVNYSTGQLRESSTSTAALLLGDGTFVNAPGVATLHYVGTLAGHLRFDFGGSVSASRAFAFAPTTNATRWEAIDYDMGASGLTSPRIAGPLTELAHYTVEPPPSPLPSQALLQSAGGFHYAAVLRIAENPETLPSPPSQLLVNLVSYSATGTELDRRNGVVLTRLLSDNEPQWLVYHNDLSKPIIFFDQNLDETTYPLIVPLNVANSGGSVRIIPPGS